MEFVNEEFIKEHGLSEAQVNAFKTGYDSHIAEIKKGWDGKALNDANKIIDGVIESAKKFTGLDIPKNQGEKHAAYLERLGNEYFKGAKSEFEKSKLEYDEKIKNFKGADEMKAQLDKVITEKDGLLQKYASFDEFSDKATKYDALFDEHQKMKLEVAFGQVKPNFPDSVNPYEAAALWGEFKDKVLKDYDIEIVDGKAVYKSKENEYKNGLLSDLVKSDETITELTKGRQQAGPNSKPVTKEKIDGIPFEVPKGASVADISKSVKEYLTKKGISVTSPEYTRLFSEYSRKIQEQQTAA